jgi:hypothetical protein
MSTFLERGTRNVAGRVGQDGAILIIALGVLTLLAILGATFASLMRLESLAAANYVESQRMDVLTQSALDRMIAQLHDADNRRSWSFYGRTPWLYLLKTEQDLAHGRVNMEDDRVGEWFDYAEVAGKRYRYKTKVIDCAAQINLNGRQDTLARMLDNLGEAIEKSPRLKYDPRRRITNPFYTAPNHGGNRVRGEEIMLFRQRLEGQRFQSKLQLRQLIGHENFEIVKDFLTCHSWEDPFTYRADDGDNEVRDLSAGPTLAQGGGRTLGGGTVQRQPAASGTPRLAHEPRHPININTAPEEVLIAALQGLACRRLFPYSRLEFGGGQLENIDRQAQIQGQRLMSKEEVRDVRPRAVFVYSQKLEYEHAAQIARDIIAQRKDPTRFFRAWRTNDPTQPGFEDFVDQLDETRFPPPSNVIVIDPDEPHNRLIRNNIISGAANPIGRMWEKGNAQGIERQIRSALGLAVHERHSWYYEMMRAMLKANFNPNTRINRYNPNVPAYIAADKSDLVWAETNFILKKGHTTEFCFDPMGIYEITTLGEISGVGRSGPGATRVEGLATSGEAFPFRRKMRTIVQIYDNLRHTSQFHFEKTFNSGSRSSAANRRYTVTWPEPMEALTELYSQGSRRDGRIELAGLLDGIRKNHPLSTRAVQAYQQRSGVLMELGLQDRDPASHQRLRIAMRGGGGAYLSEPVTDALKDVFNANVSRYRSTYRRFYRRSEMQALVVFSQSPAAAYADPIIEREERGTDLFPDGFHSSIFRMPHLNNRLIVLPARGRIGESAPGVQNVKVGASGLGSKGQNAVGNVAYYNGGIAFWVKFEFDGDDPVFSGLIGCTQVISEVPPIAQDFTGSEGTQFFIFKNTLGQLRIERLYYHQAFPEVAAGGSSTTGGAGVTDIQLYPNPGVPEGQQEGDSRNPIIEHLDQKKPISRSSVLVDVRHFKAHEWHHIAVDWNDQNPAFDVRLWVDFKSWDNLNGRPLRPQQIIDGTANSWVRLNERQPKDGLQIGGIVRNQAVEDAGIFKWFTNSTTTEAGSSGVKTIAESVKRILANATIDDVITYEGTFPEVKSAYGGGTALPGYFTNQTGEYANVFEVPLPPDIDQVVLRSFDWTSYYPTTYTDSLPGSVPQRLDIRPIECQLSYNSYTSPPAAFHEPWRHSSVVNPVAGRAVVRRGGGIKGTSAEVVYWFKMYGARAQTGSTAGGVVQTPVIDDVTLSYFLPSPRILQQEEAD